MAKPVVRLLWSISGEPLIRPLLTPTTLWLGWGVSILIESTLIVLFLIGALVTSVEPGPFTLPAVVVCTSLLLLPLIAERRRGTTVVLVEVFTSAMVSLVTVEPRSFRGGQKYDHTITIYFTWLFHNQK